MTPETEKKQQADVEEELDLPERYHSPGCPADPDDLEWWTTTQVTGPNAGKEVEITRCVSCGGQLEKVVEE